MKSKSRSNKRTTRRKRNLRNKSLRRRRGGVAPPPRRAITSADVNEVSVRIASAINLFSGGRWARDFAVIDGNHIKLKVSASNQSSNENAMNAFIGSLESQIQQINRDLEEREQSGRIVGDERIPTSRITITDMNVRNITSEVAQNMATRPTFMPLSGYDIDEDLDDWDSGIHKLIEFDLRVE